MRVDGIRRLARRERCVGCGARFRRGRGATIAVERGEQQLTRSAGEWLRVLGGLSLPERAAEGVILGPEQVVVRVAAEQRPLHDGAELLGWIESFGPPMNGRLTLTIDQLRFERPPPAGSDDAVLAWPLRAIRAVQPASSALQIATGRTVAAIRFPNSSLRLWSRAVTTRLRLVYAAESLEITEFQPCIRTCTAGLATAEPHDGTRGD
jgi:hypothetical protein